MGPVTCRCHHALISVLANGSLFGRRECSGSLYTKSFEQLQLENESHVIAVN